MKKWKNLTKGIPKKTYKSTPEYLWFKNHLHRIMVDTKFSIESCKFTTLLDYLIYESDSTAYTYPDGSHLRFKTRANSIDITRVWVNPENHRKGLGTYIMNIFMGVVTDYFTTHEKLPKIVLECSGTVGLGENQQQTPIESQLKFFSKFGFEVVRVDSYGYHHMQLTEEGFYNWLIDFQNLKKYLED